MRNFWTPFLRKEEPGDVPEGLLYLNVDYIPLPHLLPKEMHEAGKKQGDDDDEQGPDQDGHPEPVLLGVPETDPYGNQPDKGDIGGEQASNEEQGVEPDIFQGQGAKDIHWSISLSFFSRKFT